MSYSVCRVGEMRRRLGRSALQYALLLGMALLLGACSWFGVTEVVQKYDRDSRLPYYALDSWSLSGRAGLQGPGVSGSPNIEWRHVLGLDELLLSGPLGQGAVSVKMSAGHVEIDQGDGKPEIAEHPDELLARRLGVFVPIDALRYWVLGLPQADRDFVLGEQGFEQSGWDVRYTEWMPVGTDSMPRKLVVQKGEFKLKLVIDEWELPDGSAR